MKICDSGSTTPRFARIKINIDLTLPLGQGNSIRELSLRIDPKSGPADPPRIPIANRKQVLF